MRRSGAVLWPGSTFPHVPREKSEQLRRLLVESAPNTQQVDSAINRYLDETRRVLSVLEKELTDGNKEWLVGGRVSYADISFVVWNKVADVQFKSLAGWREEYPRVAEWDRKMNEMPSVAKCIAEWSSFVEVALKKRGM